MQLKQSILNAPAVLLRAVKKREKLWNENYAHTSRNNSLTSDNKNINFTHREPWLNL